MEPGRDLNLHPGLRRVPCVPHSREREQDSRPEEQKRPMSKKVHLVQSNIHQVADNVRAGRCRHTWIFFLSGLGWHLHGLSEVPT